LDVDFESFRGHQGLGRNVATLKETFMLALNKIEQKMKSLYMLLKAKFILMGSITFKRENLKRDVGPQSRFAPFHTVAPLVP